MELLEQVHGDEGQNAVLGGANDVALVSFADGVVLFLVRSPACQHCPPPPTDSLW